MEMANYTVHAWLLTNGYPAHVQFDYPSIETAVARVEQLLEQSTLDDSVTMRVEVECNAALITALTPLGGSSATHRSKGAQRT